MLWVAMSLSLIPFLGQTWFDPLKMQLSSWLKCFSVLQWLDLCCQRALTFLRLFVCKLAAIFFYPLGLWPFFLSVVRHSLKGSGSQAQSVLSVERARES